MNTTHFVHTVPATVITHILSFLDSNTRKDVSRVHKTLQSLYNNTIETLTLAVAEGEHRTRPSQMSSTSPSILVKLVRRFPNLKKFCLAEGFNQYHADILNPLLLSLQESYPKKLTHVTLANVPICHETASEISDLTQECLNTFANPQTLSLSILNRGFATELMVQTALKTSVNLTSFTLDNSNNFKQEFELSEKIVFQLFQCTKLTELALYQVQGAEVKKALCRPHNLKLRVFILNTVLSGINEDESLSQVTQHLPDLEIFSNSCCFPDRNEISEKGMLQLALRCTKLTTLRFNCRKISNKGLIDFSQNSSQLKKIWLEGGHNITSEGICGLAENCKQLESLHLTHLQGFSSDVLAALATHCTGLLYLNIWSVDESASLEDVKTFVKTCKSLRYLSIASATGTFRPLKELFNPGEEFSHLQTANKELFDKV